MVNVAAVMAYLKHMREAARPRVTQQDIARAAGVDVRQVRRWEASENAPSLAGILAYLRKVGAQWPVIEGLAQSTAPADVGERLAGASDAEVEAILAELQQSAEGRARVADAARSRLEARR